MLRTFAALSWVLAGGCLLTTNLDGLEGPPVVTATDGGVDATIGPPTDGGSDVREIIDDGPSDSSSKTCAALFCADFDESASVTNGWDMIESTPKGSVALETSEFVSAPHSFAATVTANTDFQAACLAKYFKQAPTAVLHLDMNVYLDQVDYAMGGVSFAVFGEETGAGASYSHARLFIENSTTVRLGEEYTGADGAAEHHVDATYSWPLQRWVHVRVDVTATTLSLALDGTVYATLAKLGSWNEDPSLSTTALKLGIYYSAGQQQRVIIDDVVFDDK